MSNSSKIILTEEHKKIEKKRKFQRLTKCSIKESRKLKFIELDFFLEKNKLVLRSEAAEKKFKRRFFWLEKNSFAILMSLLKKIFKNLIERKIIFSSFLFRI